eukprot:m.46924 g.46924  ORF g.46924 m.46924 type:complete len:168 (+) comp20374_c1_seq1:263-766(+)
MCKLKLMAVAAAIATAVLIQRCIAFDRQRRAAPHFKPQLIQKRKSQKAIQEAAKTKMLHEDMVKASLWTKVRSYSMDQLLSVITTQFQFGQMLLRNGDTEAASQHLEVALLAYYAASAGDEESFLSVARHLQAEIPHDCFLKTMQRVYAHHPVICDGDRAKDDDENS